MLIKCVLCSELPSFSERCLSLHPSRSLRICPCSWQITTKSLRLAKNIFFKQCFKWLFCNSFVARQILLLHPPVLAAAARSDKRLRGAVGRHCQPVCRLLREQDVPYAQWETHAAQSMWIPSVLAHTWVYLKCDESAHLFDIGNRCPTHITTLS